MLVNIDGLMIKGPTATSANGTSQAPSTSSPKTIGSRKANNILVAAGDISGPG
jgi:hypothetical protein